MYRVRSSTASALRIARTQSSQQQHLQHIRHFSLASQCRVASISSTSRTSIPSTASSSIPFVSQQSSSSVSVSVSASASASSLFSSPYRAFSSSHSSKSHDYDDDSSSSSSPFLSRVLSPLLPYIFPAGVPKGWEKYFPQGRKTGRTSTKQGQGTTAGEGKEQQQTGGQQQQQSKGQQQQSSRFNSRGSGSNNSGGEEHDPYRTQKLLVGFSTLGLLGYLALSYENDGNEITYQEFVTKMLETHRVEKIDCDITTLKVIVTLKRDGAANQPAITDTTGGTAHSRDNVYHFTIGSVDSFERNLHEAQVEMGVAPHDHVSVRYVNSGAGVNWASIIFQVAIFGAIFYTMRNMMSGAMGMGGGGKAGKNNPFSFGKSTATLIKPGDSKITFKDVAGLDDAKVEVLEFVKFLQAPERFKRLGAKIPKGALLCGPPGTGKTLLAKAVAGEAGVPFFSISGSDFLEMFVGVGPSRVRDLFAQARASVPCIIFIDEIDAVGRARSAKGFSGGNDERENTLNQLLVEMDGMGSSEGVVVLAGTNRKDMLDKALLRPGRFDRHITIDKPDMKGRAQIFMVHLAPLKTDPQHTKDDLSQRLAALTPGFAGADIANLCNEAALIAARADKPAIELSDFERASDRVIGGLEKKSSTMSPEEKSLVAHHEAGHAVAAWFLEHADPLLKVTIVPRGNGALGFAQYLPKELSLYHQAQLSDMMAMALGGRAAEQIFFGRVSTGASDDLQKVTRIAQAQITTYGMSERLGNVSYASDNENQFVKPFSEATAQAIDEEVRTLISQTYKRVLELLEKHKSQVKALADKLIETENVNHDVLLAVLGPRPFASDAYTTWRKQSQEATELAKKKLADVAEALKNGETTTTPDLAPAA